MDDDNRERRTRPTTDQPLNAKPRGNLTPALAVVGLIVLIAGIFLLITVVRYTT